MHSGRPSDNSFRTRMTARNDQIIFRQIHRLKCVGHKRDIQLMQPPCKRQLTDKRFTHFSISELTHFPLIIYRRKNRRLRKKLGYRRNHTLRTSIVGKPITYDCDFFILQIFVSFYSHKKPSRTPFYTCTFASSSVATQGINCVSPTTCKISTIFSRAPAIISLPPSAFNLPYQSVR